MFINQMVHLITRALHIRRWFQFLKDYTAHQHSHHLIKFMEMLLTQLGLVILATALRDGMVQLIMDYFKALTTINQLITSQLSTNKGKFINQLV